MDTSQSPLHKECVNEEAQEKPCASGVKVGLQILFYLTS